MRDPTTTKITATTPTKPPTKTKAATESTLCLIRDALTGNRITLRVRPGDGVHSLYDSVCLNMDRSKDSIQLLLAPSAPASVAKATPPVTYSNDQLTALSACDQRTLAEIGVDFATAHLHTIIMRDTPKADASNTANCTANGGTGSKAARPTGDSPVEDVATATSSRVSSPQSPRSLPSTVTSTPSPLSPYDDIDATSPPVGVLNVSVSSLSPSPAEKVLKKTTTTGKGKKMELQLGKSGGKRTGSVSPVAYTVKTSTTDSSSVTTTATSPSKATNEPASTSPKAGIAKSSPSSPNSTAAAAVPIAAVTATIPAPPPVPPPAVPAISAAPTTSTTTRVQHSQSRLNGSDEVMDVDQDQQQQQQQLPLQSTTSDQSSSTRPRYATPSTSTANANNMLMLCSPNNPTPSATQRYVGLVNQAMTCYLNSLLQALYMTPEFRNAMYKWENKDEQRRKCIPFELQKLFLLLQTSTRSAVETTDLTRSFGWDSSEAWHQHDVQELCRVMFDALERTFKKTEQADLINQLYEGKMIDYVKCLECQTEKSREDAFLDIPLPVRPFGRKVAYESIEEALRGFVEPERLDGTNQYFCEKCNSKCDADKGLKFSRFPYVLTLHLKRFDFDYSTFHRIKLNDKVTFPETLNLNHLVKETRVSTNGISTTVTNGSTATSEHGSVESAIKGDDCSTTDSDCGVLDDDVTTNSSASPHNNNNNNNIINNNNNLTHNTNAATAGPTAGATAAVVSSSGAGGDADLMSMGEDDEGIDVTSTTDTKSSISTSVGAGAAIMANESGPYIYELFAIMIHSGSASGGHYYAYIKEFESHEWYCFNDQSVTPASKEDINRSFGGGPSGTKSYYSSAYSSSTNAYMLMYRQMDPQRNVAPMRPEEFPPHIQQLMQRLHDKKEADRYAREQEEVRVNFKVFWRHPQTRMLREKRFNMNVSQSLEEALADAHEQLDVGQFTPLKRCRLVAFELKSGERITRSYEGDERKPMEQSLAPQLLHRSATTPIEFLLETRSAGDDEFEPIQSGSIGTLVYRVTDLEAGDVDDESVLDVRTMSTATVGEYKEVVARKLRTTPERLVLALLTSSSLVTLLDTDCQKVDLVDMVDKSKVFVVNVDAPVPVGLTVAQRLGQIVGRFENILTLYFLLPNTDKETLEKMSIPSYEERLAGGSRATPSPSVSSAKSSPNAIDRCSDVTMSSTPSPTRPITIATSVGQWNATCDVDDVDAHMNATPSNHYNSHHHHHQQPQHHHNNIQHNTTSYTVKLPRISAHNDTVPSAAAAYNATGAAAAAITASATVTLPLGRSSGGAAEQPESNSEDSSLSDSDRTLVDDNGAGADLPDLSSTNNSPACSDTQLSSPECLSRHITDFDCDDDDDVLDGKHYFRAVLLDDEAAAAVAATTMSSTTNNSSSSNSSTTGEYGPKQQQQRTLKVKVDSAMILGNLKRSLERFVCVPKEYMKIFRHSTTHSESECTSVSQTLQQFKEGERLSIELGRALRKGEYKCKVSYMRLVECSAMDFERLQPVCDYIVCSGASVASTKRGILAQLAQLDPIKYNASYESCRLRRKVCRSPNEVYQDDQKFNDDILISESGMELILQECDESSEPCTSVDDKCIFIRRWNPSTYTMSTIQEITLVCDAHDDLRELIAKASGSLNADDVEYMKVSGPFPRYDISILSVDKSNAWTDRQLFVDEMPLRAARCGDMYFYRDKNEKLKELTPEERRTISRAENGSSSFHTTYSSPRRERSLKIYLDPSPKKANSFDLMK